MTEYDALIKLGDKWRGKGRTMRALNYYFLAYVMGGTRRRHIEQMVGVCYLSLRKANFAMVWLKKALAGATAVEEGNILRDIAQAHSDLGDYWEAEECLHQALMLLPRADHPVAHAATLGFCARLGIRKGDVHGALRQFSIANTILTNSNNRQIELYIKCDYAAALALADRGTASRWMALQAFKLALKYGGVPHVLRALALIIGAPATRRFATRKLVPTVV